MAEGYEDSADYPLNGYLADIRVFNTARSSTDISGDYNTAISPALTGLVGYWKCTEGGGAANDVAAGLPIVLTGPVGWVYTGTSPFTPR
jgi:hypothetical protein